MILATIAYRIDSSRKNAWKIYLAEGHVLKRNSIGVVQWQEQRGFYASVPLHNSLGTPMGLMTTGPFLTLEAAAKHVAQQSYEYTAPLLSANPTHEMPEA